MWSIIRITGEVSASKTSLNPHPPVDFLLNVRRWFLCCSSSLCVDGFICGDYFIIVPHLSFFFGASESLFRGRGISLLWR